MAEFFGTFHLANPGTRAMIPMELSPALPAHHGLQPGRLWSLWDMLIFDAGLFANVLDDVARLDTLLRGDDPWLDQPVNRNYFAGRMTLLIKELQQLGLKTSTYKAALMKIVLENPEKFEGNEGRRSTLQQYCGTLRENLHVELDGSKFYGPLPAYQKYYDQIELFGADVFKTFPSANDDIYEAGMCLALERGTACVMHLMRVQEAGLKALAGALGVTNKNDWGSYLRQIQTELDGRAKSAGARTADEEFYSESAATFDRLKRAYRNPTMHPDKSYSTERAEQILLAAKGFMQTLATRLSEVP